MRAGVVLVVDGTLVRERDEIELQNIYSPNMNGNGKGKG